MKKIIVAMMAIFLICSACFAIFIKAEAETEFSGDTEAFTQAFMQAAGISEARSIRVQSLALLDETFFVYLNNMTVYAWKPGDQMPSLHCSLPQPPPEASISFKGLDAQALEKLNNTVSYIAAGDGALWGLNVFSGKVGKISKEGIAWQDTKLDVSRLNPEDDATPRRVTQAFVQEGMLYLLIALDESYADFNEYELLRYELSSGACTPLDAEGLQGVALYQRGFLLILRLNPQKAYALSVLNLSTGSLKDLDRSLPSLVSNTAFGGLAYDTNSDCIYLTAQNQVFVNRSDAPFKAAAFVPALNMTGETSAWVLPDGRYALGFEGIYVRRAQEELTQTTLRIKAGYVNLNILNDFVKENPDILITEMNETAKADDLSQDVTSGLSDTDIYQINLDYAFGALVQKGYCTDMSGSKIISADVDLMYPFVQKLITDSQNHPVAYPVDMWLSQISVNHGYWTLIFGDMPLPATFDELMDAMLLWETDYADEYPEIDFLMNFDHAYWVNEIIKAYVQQYEQPSQRIDVSDPLLKNVLHKLENVCRIRKSKNRSVTFVSMDDWGERCEIFSILNEMPLLSYEQHISPRQLSDYIYGVDPSQFSPSPLVFQISETPNTRATLGVWVINPLSKNKEAALRFIEYAARVKNNPRVYYALHPDINEPYENPKFQRLINDMTNRQSQLLEALEGLQGNDRLGLNDMLQYVEGWLENQENERWLISPQAITHYRLTAPGIRFYENSLYLGASGNSVQEQIKSLCRRYADEQLNLDLFISELNQMMNMISLESR